MGAYSDKLSGRLRGAVQPALSTRPDAERLKCVAIIRDGKLHKGPRSHWELRSDLGDEYPQTSNLNDVEGFFTSAGRFVNRVEAQDVALAAGQIRQRQDRPLLSSDVDWEAK